VHDALELAQIGLEAPAQGVGGDEHAGERVGKGQAVVEPVDHVEVPYSPVSRFGPDELPQSRDGLEGIDRGGDSGCLEGDPAGARATVDHGFAPHIDQGGDLAEIPGVER